MPLLPLSELAADLVCPRCRSALTDEGEGYGCPDPQCGLKFPVVGGHPILVDFDQSILVEDQVRERAGGSAIRRGKSSGAKSAALRVMLPPNQAAARNAERLIELSKATAERPRVLIVGGGSEGEGTEALYRDASLQLIAFDIYGSELTQFVADAHQTPLGDSTVDAIWIQAVLEHVLDPWRVAAEIHRVLKPGGLVYAETPFMQQVHEGPYDFTRFTESGHRWLFRDFEEVDSGVVLGPASQLLWSIDHVVRGVFRSVRAGVMAKMLLFWLRFLDRLIPREYASDAASAVYFLGRKSGTSIGPKEMVAYYKGAHARTG